jgi:cation:H+ antiporter
MIDYFMLFLGVLCAGVGGELFLRGTVGLARGLRVAPAIIGATVAAFANSSPEPAVGIGAALAGKPQISLGDILGSNIFNSLFIVAVAVLITPIEGAWQEVLTALGFGLVSVALIYPARSGWIGRWRGMLLLLLSALYLASAISAAG